MKTQKKKSSDPTSLSHTFMAVLVLLAGWSLYILHPYLLILLEALTLTAILYPTYTRILKFLKNRYIASFVTIGIVVFFLFIFSAILVGGFISQTTSALDSLRIAIEDLRSMEDLPPRISERIEGVRSSIISFLGSTLTSIINAVPSYLKIFSNFATHMILLLIATFYLLVDGSKIFNSIASYSHDEGRDLKNFINYAEKMVGALITGLVGVSILKAISNGISFYIFGVSSPLFWMLMMVILGIIPLVGPFLIWFPIGIYAIFSVSPATGLAIIIWGLISDNVFDNIVYPRLVSHESQVHPLIIIFGVFAGLQAYGIAGVILGPLIFSLTLAILVVYLDVRRCEWGGSDCDPSLDLESHKKR
ncbi:MAG: AI-2E family transporter [Candidatus Altiarchaeota archaeon]